MSMRYAIPRCPWAILGVLLSLTLAGCQSAPAEAEAEPEPHGVVISVAGTPLVTVEDALVTGTLNVDVGDETADFDIVFTDADGNPLEGDLSDFFAEATVENEDVAFFHTTDAFQAHVQGISAGTTTMVLHFMHPAGSADAQSSYDTPSIAIIVS